MRRLVAVLTLAVVMAMAPSSAIGATRVQLSDIEDEVMCPTCGTPLSLSDSPLAQRERAFIQRRIDRGATKDEIKAALAREFGEEVLAMPPARGFSVAAYLVPVGALALVLTLIGVATRRRRRQPAESAPDSMQDGFEGQVDADLLGLRSRRGEGA